MKRILGWLIVCLANGITAFAAAPLEVKSPDGKLQLTFEVKDEGRLTYSFRADGRELIQSSPVGFEGGKLAGSSRRSVNTAWKPLWGKRAVVPDRFNELTLDLTTYRLEARAYDDGVAFRYVGGAGPDQTQFRFAGDYTAWFYNGEHHNLGPEKLSESDGQRLPVDDDQGGRRLLPGACTKRTWRAASRWCCSRRKARRRSASPRSRAGVAGDHVRTDAGCAGGFALDRAAESAAGSRNGFLVGETGRGGLGLADQRRAGGRIQVCHVAAVVEADGGFRRGESLPPPRARRRLVRAGVRSRSPIRPRAARSGRSARSSPTAKPRASACGFI